LTKQLPKHNRVKSELLDMVSRPYKNDSDVPSSFLPTHAHSGVDEPVPRTNSLLHFKKKIPQYSNESHIDRAIVNRLKSLKKLDIQEAKEPKLAIKQQSVVNKTQSLMASVRKTSPQGSLRTQSIEEPRSHMCTRFVYILVFDRVIFAGSNVVSWCVYMKPRDVPFLHSATRVREHVDPNPPEVLAEHLVLNPHNPRRQANLRHSRPGRFDDRPAKYAPIT
jgi:hypothetical protein